jgi:hypothetical protein
MSDPTKFPAMHIAESVFNRIMNMKSELMPATIPTIPKLDSGTGGESPDQINKMISDAKAADTTAASAPLTQTQAIDTAIQGTNMDAALQAAGPSTGVLGAGAGAGLDSAAAIDAGMMGSGAVGGAAEGAGILGAGAAGAGAAAGGAAVAGEAVASGAELLPLLLA